MLRPKIRLLLFRPLVTRRIPVPGLAVYLFMALLVAAAFCSPLHAQSANTITVLMLDGKTGRPIVPSNFIVRVDHLNATHNEWLKLNDDGTGSVTLPAGTSFLSVQGTLESSMEIYVNCDAGMEKDVSTLHWYSVPDILSAGVAMPNECYKGKYADATKVTPKPGEFILFVRKINWHELPPD
jgi:hypothetical protein